MWLHHNRLHEVCGDERDLGYIARLVACVFGASISKDWMLMSFGSLNARVSKPAPRMTNWLMSGMRFPKQH